MKFKIERLEERIAPGKLQCACTGGSHKGGSHKGGSHKGGSHKGGSSKVKPPKGGSSKFRCSPPPPPCS